MINFATSFLVFEKKNKVRYFMRIVCQHMSLLKYHLLFLKKQQNLKLSSAANYRWRFKGSVVVFLFWWLPETRLSILKVNVVDLITLGFKYLKHLFCIF